MLATLAPPSAHDLAALRAARPPFLLAPTKSTRGCKWYGDFQYDHSEQHWHQIQTLTTTVLLPELEVVNAPAPTLLPVEHYCQRRLRTGRCGCYLRHTDRHGRLWHEWNRRKRRVDSGNFLQPFVRFILSPLAPLPFLCDSLNG